MTSTSENELLTTDQSLNDAETSHSSKPTKKSSHKNDHRINELYGEHTLPWKSCRTSVLRRDLNKEQYVGNHGKPKKGVKKSKQWVSEMALPPLKIFVTQALVPFLKQLNEVRTSHKVTYMNTRLVRKAAMSTLEYVNLFKKSVITGIPVRDQYKRDDWIPLKTSSMALRKKNQPQTTSTITTTPTPTGDGQFHCGTCDDVMH